MMSALLTRHRRCARAAETVPERKLVMSHRRLAATLLGALFLLAGPAWADQTVRTAEELKTAAADAEPGETIRLAPGRYEGVFLRGVEGAENRAVTITSADPADPARLGDMRLHQSAHVTFDGLVFDYVFSADDKIHLRPFQVTDSQDVAIRNALFDGDVAQGVSENSDGFGFAFGLGVSNVQGMTVENNEIHTFFRGLVVSKSQDVVVRNNDVHSLRMDGMNFAQVQDVRIEKNHIHDFVRSPDSRDHADMIQFWTNRTSEPTRNVIIRDNVLNSGDGLFTQSIFMRNDLVDRGKAGREMFYRDISIKDNVVINAHLHGISLGESDGVEIENNSVIRNARSEGERDNPPLYDPRIFVSSKSHDVRIVGNVVSRIAGFKQQSDWEAHDNFLIQDRHQLRPGYYGHVFANALEGDPGNLSSFYPKPDGPLDGSGYGAPRLSPTE